jgi:hypothetical protein
MTVVLGPVDITDVIKEADISFEQPLDFGQGIVHTAPDYPLNEWPATALTASVQADQDAPRIVAASFAEQPVDINASQFKVSPIASSYGIGLKFETNAGAPAQVRGQALISVAAPRLNFNLRIVHGRVETALVSLSGASGLSMWFEAGSNAERAGNVNAHFVPPVDLSIPISGPFPFAVTVRHHFIVKTAFGVKNSMLQTVGEYELAGGFRAGYQNGTFTLAGPTRFTEKKGFLTSLNGISTAVSGVTLAYQARVIVGIGAFGFATGPYVEVDAGLGASRASDLGMLACKGTTLNVDLSAGVGYLVPQAVTSAINFFLRKLNIGEIKGEGGFRKEPPVNLINVKGTEPNVKGCRT